MDNLIIYNPEYTKVRIGRKNDGGYVICNLPTHYDYFVSGGISSDISFEQAFLDKYPSVQCIAFDGTIDNLPKVDPRISFIKKNLGKDETDTTTNLHSVIEPYSNIFMKIDIEGHEYCLFSSFTEEHMKKISQLVLEIHTPGDIALHPEYFVGLSDITNTVMFDLLKKLNTTHTLVHLHPNNGCKTYHVDGVHIPNVFECTYILNDYVKHRTPNSESLPLSIDMPNIPRKPIVKFDSYPFVTK
jgi:hypothetical protein